MTKYNLIHFLALTILSIFSFSLFAGQNIDPQEACNYLTNERFRGNLEYKESKRSSGNYSCGSLRKPIDKGEPTTSDLRYSVIGSDSSVSQISLLLRMNSFKISTPVLKEFAKVSGVIYLKAFNESMPEDIERSMLSAGQHWSRYFLNCESRTLTVRSSYIKAKFLKI